MSAVKAAASTARSSFSLSGAVLLPGGFVEGEILVGENGRIEQVSGAPISADQAAKSNCIILPGFVDSHVHGGGGRDTMEGGDAVTRIAEIHARHGTTSMLATTMTAPAADLEVAFIALGKICGSPIANGARVLGVHLEGPYINAGMLGAQPDFVRPLASDELRRLHQLAPIRLITLAPETNNNAAMIRELVAAGFIVQLGHSAASFEETIAALADGAKGFTHLYNAMTGMHHRKPGMVGAALSEAQYAEIIPDLLHVHAGAIRVALRAIPKLFCVTDSTAASGMPDGEYRLGRNTVTKCMGGVRLADGTLAGSTLTMDQALRNLVQLGLALDDASKRVSTYAADYLGLADRGRLQKDAWADLVVLDRELQLEAVYVEGNKIVRR